MQYIVTCAVALIVQSFKSSFDKTLQADVVS